MKFPPKLQKRLCPLCGSVLAITLSGGMALLLALYHLYKIDIPLCDFITEWHNKIMSNESYYPDQYRIFTYYLAHALTNLDISLTAAFFTIRFTFTFLSFIVLYFYLLNFTRRPTAIIGLIITAFSMVFTYRYYSCQPTDPLNMLIYFLAFYVLLNHKDFWLYPLLIIGMLNRETVILLPMAYAFIRYKEKPWETYFASFFSLSIIVFAIYLGLRFVFGMKEPYASTSVVHYLKTNLFEVHSWFSILAFFNISLFLAFLNFKSKPIFLKRACLILPFFMIIHYLVGYVREVRYFLAIVPIFLPLTLINFETMIFFNYVGPKNHC